MPRREKTKVNVKERVEENLCDLSLSELNDVPVAQIAAFKRVTILDLSSNRLTTLGKNFVTLTRLVKLDLSKNQLKYLPDDFGLLHNLRHLDLYDNKLEHLPLSFGELSNLRYLDLKANPLVPGLTKIVGFCLTLKECQDSARNTVRFMATMQIEAEKLREHHRQLVTAATEQEETESELCVEPLVVNANTAAAASTTIVNHRNTIMDSNQNMNDNQNSNNQPKSRKSSRKHKTRNKHSQQNHQHQQNVNNTNKAVQTNPEDLNNIPKEPEDYVVESLTSTALSSILMFFFLLALNVLVIYIIMLKNPEIIEKVINLLPQQYRNWIMEKTDFLRWRLTDYITEFVTPPEEH